MFYCYNKALNETMERSSPSLLMLATMPTFFERLFLWKSNKKNVRRQKNKQDNHEKKHTREIFKNNEGKWS